MEVKNIGHQDSITMGTYDIEEIEKSNENKVEIMEKKERYYIISSDRRLRG